MELFDAIRSRRSVRKFVPQPVARAALDQIVQAGIEAPSGCNAQLRHFVVVDEPAVIDQLRPVSTALATAPAVIVLLIEPKATPYGEYFVQDASAAMENMLLAATALGLAACWVEGAVRRAEQQIRNLLAVPDHLRVWSCLPVGKPAESPARPAKSAFADVVRYNRYG